MLSLRSDKSSRRSLTCNDPCSGGVILFYQQLLSEEVGYDTYANMKLISINIEGDKHFDSVLPFLKGENPDVLCLQEVFETDLDNFKALGYTCSFLPQTKKLIDNVDSNHGCALCTHGEMQNVQSFYYQNGGNPLPEFNNEERLRSINEIKRGVLCADTLCNGSLFKIATTHFTWTPKGESPSDEQIRSVKVFLEKVKGMEPHIMCGDFNIPRTENFLYGELVKHYTDTVPLTYTSSLDATLHRAGPNPEKKHLFDSFMVDYVFTQPPYTAHDVRLGFGVSDHAAVVATIEKT